MLSFNETVFCKMKSLQNSSNTIFSYVLSALLFFSLALLLVAPANAMFMPMVAATAYKVDEDGKIIGSVNDKEYHDGLDGPVDRIHLPWFYHKYGAVYSRGLWTDDAGKMKYVEYGANGDEVKEVIDHKSSYVVFGGDEYRQLLDLKDKITAEHQNHVLVLTVKQYREKTFLTADGKSIAKPPIPNQEPEILSVIVRDPAYLFGPGHGEDLLLAQFEINVSINLDSNAKSLIFDKKKEGAIVAQSQNNIGLRVGFFERDGYNKKYQEDKTLGGTFLFCGQEGVNEFDRNTATPLFLCKSNDELDRPNDKLDFSQTIIDMIHYDLDRDGGRLFALSPNINNPMNMERMEKDRIYQPIKNVMVFTGAPFPTGWDSTDKKGNYYMYYFLPPCMGFATYLPSYAYASLHYSMFNPRLLSPSYPYFLRQMDFDFCNNIISGTIPLPKNPLDFPVDLTVLSGYSYIANNDSPVAFGSETKFGYSGNSGGIIAQQKFDFDGDGKPDQSILGHMEYDPLLQREAFVTGGAELQGVYLSSTPNSPNNPDPVLAQPNLTRVVDHQQDVEVDIKLLSISRDDMKNTDIIVARESNGKIIAERRGVDFNEAHLAEVGIDDDKEALFYTVKLRGPRETFYHVPPWAMGVMNMALPNPSPCELPKLVGGMEFWEHDDTSTYMGIPIAFAKTQAYKPCRKDQAGKNNESVTDDELKVKEITDWEEYAKIPFAKWQADDDIVEEFRQRNSDLPRPGEKVRVIAINRVTGYIGSITTELKSAGSTNPDVVDYLFSQTEESHRPKVIDGLINLGKGHQPLPLVTSIMDSAVQSITMRPPNLKVWARRTTKIENGATKGQAKEYFVGDEGSGTNSDVHIEIYTEWLDHDGRALPESLVDHGYTGRLAKLTGSHKVGPAGGALAQFNIAPGRHVQVISLPDQSINKTHLYLQVNPSPMNRNPDFSGSGRHGGLLNDRPNKLVPVQVPVYDENATLIQEMAYNLVNSGGDNRPEPIYRWISRPEYTFSIFDLEIYDIFRKENAQTPESNIIDLTNPKITSMDEYINIGYSLEMRPTEPLNRFMGGQELVFALGAQEIKATLGINHEIVFDSYMLQHLAALDSEDFMTIRLYANNDPGNNLWEFAFPPSCEVSPLTPITDAEALIFEGGKTVDLSKLDSDMTIAHQCVKKAVEAAGGELKVDSAYRPPAYQRHLLEVWNKWVLLNRARNNQPECQDLKKIVENEKLKHKLVAQPASERGMHTKGKAIDMDATGISTEKFLDIATGEECKLYRRMPIKDPVHFERKIQ